MTKKLTISAFVFLILCTSLFAQKKNPKFIFDFDYAQFGYDSTSNYVEVYYSFNQQTMKYVQTDSSNYLEAYLHVSIQDTSSGKYLINNKWRIASTIKDSTQISDKSLVGVISFVLPEGFYKCVVGGTAGETADKQKFITDHVNVKPLHTHDISVSDIQLASKILQDSQNKSSIFYKNTFEVVPIPTEVFGESLPVVFYYYEVYSSKEALAKDSVLQISSLVYNSKRKVVYSKIFSIKNTIKSRVEVGAIPVNKFPTDTYTLIVSVLDTAKQKGISSSKRFFVYNPKVVNTDTASAKGQTYVASVFGVMSIEECDDLYSKSKYIATGPEVDQWGKLSTLAGKREFLYNFWKKRDPDPATNQNEYFNQYLKRIQESNKKYGTITRPGWKTDRGRVYIKYGEPSEIERFPNQTDSKPYEIWHYNELEGGVIFVFADLTGFSDYQLVHSTMRGELRDDNWQRRVSSF